MGYNDDDDDFSTSTLVYTLNWNLEACTTQHFNIFFHRRLFGRLLATSTWLWSHHLPTLDDNTAASQPFFFPFPCANIYSPTKRKIIHHFAPQGREMEGRTMKAFSHALRSDELKGAQQTSLFQRQWSSKELFLTSRSHTHQRWYFQHLSLPITTTLFVVSLQIIIFHLTAGNFIQN